MGDDQVAARFEHPRQEGEMVVLHEDQGRFIFDLVEIASAISGSLAGTVPNPPARIAAGIGHMAKRPESLIGKP